MIRITTSTLPTVTATVYLASILQRIADTVHVRTATNMALAYKALSVRVCVIATGLAFTVKRPARLPTNGSDQDIVHKSTECTVMQ